MEESKNKISRRSFLMRLGSGTAAFAVASTGLGAMAEKTVAAEKSTELFTASSGKIATNFSPIQPAAVDKLVLPKGFRYDVVAAYGDPINAKGDTCGFNVGFPCYFPIDGSAVHGLVWVNHESSSSLWVEGKKQATFYTPEQVNKLLYNQGGSILELFRDKKGVWRMDTSSQYARRITALERFELFGPVRGTKSVNGATVVQGTLANSSGGRTLWGTVLSGENHFEDTCRDAGLDLTHYGWVAEIDPFNSGFKLRKHTALGRLHHGNIAMGLSKNGRIVVYSADNISGGCIYKFVSSGKFDSQKGKANSDLLSDGTLYAADLVKGEWIQLTIDEVKSRLENLQFKLPEGINQTREVLLDKLKEPADIYVYARVAALILDATPTDNPAEIIINPTDNSLYITHNSNLSIGSLHGQIIRFKEKDKDLGAHKFEFEMLAVGGSQSGFSVPDSMTFDKKGNLWLSSAIPSDKLGIGAWAKFKNNGIYLTGNSYLTARQALQFASAPTEGEFSGLCFAPDERTLFLAVQHPGEQSQDAAKPTSMWPHRSGDTAPRPALVAVTGW